MRPKGAADFRLPKDYTIAVAEAGRQLDQEFMLMVPLKKFAVKAFLLDRELHLPAVSSSVYRSLIFAPQI
jgi:hypothetical protein